MKSNALCSFVAAVATFAVAGCGGMDMEGEADPFREAVGASGKLHFQVDADKPLAQGDNDLRILIREASTNAPFVGATVDVSAMMPSMAHDVPPPDIEELDGGNYVARGLSLSMAGRWVVDIEATREQTADTVRFTYDLR